MSFNYVKSISVAAPLPALKNLDAQLLQAQKETITLMAGNSANDVNNILHVIVGFGSLSLSKMPEDDPLRANINHIIAAAARPRLNQATRSAHRAAPPSAATGVTRAKRKVFTKSSKRESKP